MLAGSYSVYASSFLTSSTDGTRPATLTVPSTTRAGVTITCKAIICLRSVTLLISYGTPSSCAAFSVTSYSLPHFAQPIPRISNCFIIRFLFRALLHRLHALEEIQHARSLQRIEHLQAPLFILHDPGIPEQREVFRH